MDSLRLTIVRRAIVGLFVITPLIAQQHGGGHGHHGGRRGDAATFPLEFRTIDGRGNNPDHANWGAAGSALVRYLASDYADGVGEPAGTGRRSAREISNLVAAQSSSIINAQQASDFVWQWGQFLDHDLTEVPIAVPEEPFPIAVPTGDPWFDPTGMGTVEIPLHRSDHVTRHGKRQQVNAITAYIDASQVYGSDSTRAAALRTLDGSGRLQTSAGNMLPFNTAGLPNAPTNAPTFFLAGDVRANEQVALTALHTLFVREHNFWADALGTFLPGLSGDEIYQIARALVGAEMQAITYNEFLPVLLGPDPLAPYDGYRDNVDPGITNIFAAAAYRVGHTMLSAQLLRLDENGNAHSTGHLPLQNAFFQPAELIATGIEPLLRGLAEQHAQAVDPFVVDDVRNFLFGAPQSGGFDLAALNIQRGRDHGLSSYNDIRDEIGRPRAIGWNDINPDPTVRSRLNQAYNSVDQVDAWVGLLAEPPSGQGMVGRTLRKLLRRQFEALRDGDRFWYQEYFSPELIDFIDSQTLAVIIRRNTAIGSELRHDVFRVD